MSHSINDVIILRLKTIDIWTFVQLAEYSVQLAEYSVQLAEYSVQLAEYTVQLAEYIRYVSNK
jgi:hypothetical protein